MDLKALSHWLIFNKGYKKNNVDNPFQSPVILSFCPGILGLERGLERAGVKCRVAAYVEIEAFIIANLVAGMEAGILDPAPIWTDAKTFDASPFCGKVHGIIGGYPCPGESLAGLREGHLYKGFIWPAIRRAIAAAKPVWCFFENVDDHLTGTYPIVQRSLRNMGYRVEAGIFSAEEVGATHERQRLFILALADTHCNAAGRFPGNLFSKGSKAEGKTQKRQRGRNEYRDGSEEMEHTNVSGFKEFGKRLSEKKTNDRIINTSEELADTINTGCGEFRGGIPIQPEIARPSYYGADKWPAGQGLYQHEWEEPRTIEPGLVCTVDGYNFRNDLLRAIGNSVVEQTAALAFVTLLKKHFLNIA